MSLDTTHRPKRFAEVLGQLGSIKILKGIVKKGAGFRQSYLFAGPWGSGKTTMGRILARALLCDNPQEGEPCDQCASCRSFIDRGGSEDFVEFDAATNSGKNDIKQITESLEYATFSGKRTIYLIDECFTEDTVLLVKGDDGTITLRGIRDLVEKRFQGEVLSFDVETGGDVWSQVTDWFELGRRNVVRLTFDNGVTITVTENQKIYTNNRGWVTASDLTDQDDVKESSVMCR